MVHLKTLLNLTSDPVSRSKQVLGVEQGVTHFYEEDVAAFKNYYLEPWARADIDAADIKACVEFDVARYRNATPALYHMAQQYWYSSGSWRALLGIEPFTINKAPVRAITIRAVNTLDALYMLSDRTHTLYFLMTSTGEVDVCDLWKPHIRQILGFSTVAGLLEIARCTRLSMAVSTTLREGHDLHGDVLFGNTYGNARVAYPQELLEEL